MKPILICALVLGSIGFLTVSLADSVRAEESVAELREKIGSKRTELARIEAEIAKFEQELTVVGAEKQTLQKAINTLDISRKKLQGEIRATETKIGATDLEIRELTREIEVKRLEILKNTDAIGESFRAVDELEQASIIETLLTHSSIAEVWDTVAAQQQVIESLREEITLLKSLEEEYASAKMNSEEKKTELAGLYDELSGEKKALDTTRTQKDRLLTETKSEESEYQKLLAERKAAREQFERELASYEAQLKFVLDKSTVPVAGSGALAWPFEPSYVASCPAYTSVLGNAHCITQYFGNTAFAQAGAYNGKGHNGVDFRASVGTKITSALTGTVRATGDTDQTSGCYSFGKWVLVDHPNGLSTLYAHLSAISVGTGQGVGTGALIGLSGNTGYSTGPHLHFGVYAKAGVKVQRLGDFTGKVTGCSSTQIPVAAYTAYLNPMDYL